MPQGALEQKAAVPLRPAKAALELTILMPCLNEAETIEVCVTKAMGYLQRAAASPARCWSPTTAPTTARKPWPKRPARASSRCPKRAMARR